MALWGFAAPRVPEHELVSVTFVSTDSFIVYVFSHSEHSDTNVLCCGWWVEALDPCLHKVEPWAALCKSGAAVTRLLWKLLKIFRIFVEPDSWFISLLICAENVSRWPQTGVCPARCSSVMTVEGEKWSLLTAPLAHTTKHLQSFLKLCYDLNAASAHRSVQTNIMFLFAH